MESFNGWKGGSKYSPYYQNLYGFNLPTCKDFGINKKCKEYAIVKQSLLNGGYDYYCGNCAFDRQTQDKFKRTRRY